MRLRHTLPALIVTAALASSAAADDREVKLYQLPRGTGPFAVHPDSRTVAFYNRGIYLLDLETEKGGSILCRDASYSGGQFTPDGKNLFLVGVEGCVIRAVDAPERAIFQPDPIGLGAFARISPDGRRVFTYTQYGDVIVWDVPTNKRIKTLVGTADPVTGLATTSDGQRLLVATPEDLSGWDLTTWKRLYTKKRPFGTVPPPTPGATTILFPPKGRRAFCVSSTKIGDDEPADNHDGLSFSALDADTGTCRLLARGSQFLKRYRAAVLSADGKYAFLGRDGGTSVHAIDTATGKEVATYLPAQLAVWNLAPTPDGKHLLIGDGRTKLLRVPIPVVLEAKPISTYEEFKQEAQKPAKP